MLFLPFILWCFLILPDYIALLKAKENHWSHIAYPIYFALYLGIHIYAGLEKVEWVLWISLGSMFVILFLAIITSIGEAENPSVIIIYNSRLIMSMLVISFFSGNLL